MEAETKKLMTVYNAAAEFNLERSTLYRRIESGTLTSYEVNNKVHVDPDELNNWGENINVIRGNDTADKVAELWEEGLPDSVIAVRIGRSRERVRQIRTKMGKKPNPRMARLPKGTYLR